MAQIFFWESMSTSGSRPASDLNIDHCIAVAAGGDCVGHAATEPSQIDAGDADFLQASFQARPVSSSKNGLPARTCNTS